MRIVHIITTLSSGGAERMITKLCAEDTENEHIIITLLKHTPHYDTSNIHIISLDLKNNILNKFLAIGKLVKTIKDVNPDIVQTWMKSNFYGPILKKMTKVKIISNFRNGYHGTNNKLVISLYNKYFNCFDENIFVSESALKERNQRGIKYQKYIIIPNGFKIVQEVNDEILSSQLFTIGHVGRFHPLKNQQLLLDAFSIFSKDKDDVILYLAGKNVNSTNLNFNKISSEKMKIWGEIKDIDSFYKKLSLFALVSKSEGFPNVIGEAMSHGVPVLTTDAGESFNIIEDSGYKLLKQDKDHLASLFEVIYFNRKELSKKGKESKERIEKNFSVNRTIELYKKTYHRIGELK